MAASAFAAPHDYANIERLSQADIARLRAEFDRGKGEAKLKQ